jgi:hypothetical protein
VWNPWGVQRIEVHVQALLHEAAVEKLARSERAQARMAVQAKASVSWRTGLVPGGVGPVATATGPGAESGNRRAGHHGEKRWIMSDMARETSHLATTSQFLCRRVGILGS